ncbi:MAG: hypothetical protein LBU65_02285 [Planctomycetaceae bacterium]|jgi:hypothetical protein|nr:hypothetical protein [Planctomycetaceae bacterium]
MPTWTRAPLFDERTKRLWAATVVHEPGWGGISAVHEATGIHRQSIRNGIQELQSIESVDVNRCRKPGGGRKENSSKYQTLLHALKFFVESTTMGNPMKPLPSVITVSKGKNTSRKVVRSRRRRTTFPIRN